MQHDHGKHELAEVLAVLLAKTVTLKFMAQGFHWNVKGKDFAQFHDFFEELYEDFEGAIDPTAESIRKLGVDAPFSLGDFLALCPFEARGVGSDPVEMSRALHEANGYVLESLNRAFACANACNSQGIADFLAGRMDAHEKWDWQLSAVTGTDFSVTVSYSDI
jgi:starvation-inducible DNA-binding protein